MDIPDWLSAIDSAGLDALHGTVTTRGAGSDFAVDQRSRTLAPAPGLRPAVGRSSGADGEP